MSKAKIVEGLTLSPVAQKTIELALRASQTPETLLCALLAQEEGNPLLVVERRKGAIRSTGRGAQMTPKALDHEGVEHFAEQITNFGEPTNVLALGIIRPQSAIAGKPKEQNLVQTLSEGESDLLNLTRSQFPHAAWQLIAEVTESGPTVTARRLGDFFSLQSAVIPNEPQTPIEFSSVITASVITASRGGRRKRR